MSVAHRILDHDLVSPCFQQAHGIRAESFLDPQFVRQPLVMHARGDRGFGDVHAVVDDVEQDLQHGGDDAAAAGAAGDQQQLAIPEDEGRCHRTERALAGADRVGVAADQPISVRYPRFGGEVVHLVVEQDAGTGGDNAGAIAKIQGIGHGDGVAVPVHHRVVRGLLAFVALGLTGFDFRRRFGSVRIDARRQLLGISLRDQAGDRYLGEIWIAQVLATVGIGEFHGFGHAVDGGGAVVT